MSITNTTSTKPTKSLLSSKLSRTPRDYQLDGLLTAMDAINSKTNTLIASPPGTGKGDLLCMIAHACHRQGKSVLFLVHKLELMRDIRHRAVTHYGFTSNDVALIYGKSRQKTGVAFHLSTQQTAHRRLSKIDMSQFDVLFIDEAHRAESATYQRILSAFSGVVIGTTGTPWREDAGALENTFQRVHWLIDMDTAIDRKYIVPSVPYSASFVDLDGVRVRSGEFVANDLNERFLIHDQKVFDYWNEVCPDRKTIIFCAGREHAARLQEIFAPHVPTGLVVHGVAPKRRAETMRRFHAGELKVLLNVNIFSEGLDDPETSCIVWATATLSRLKYVQGTMRGVRTFPGKEDTIILDFGQNVIRHGFIEDYQEDEPDRLKECPNCHHIVKARSRVCIKCGYKWVVLNRRRRTRTSESETSEPDIRATDGVKRTSPHVRIIRRYEKNNRKVNRPEHLFVIGAHYGWSIPTIINQMMHRNLAPSKALHYIQRGQISIVVNHALNKLRRDGIHLKGKSKNHLKIID